MKEMKRYLAIILATFLVFTSVVPVFAAEETVQEQSLDQEKATTNDAKYENEEIEDSIDEASPSDAEESDDEVFVREVTVDGVKIKVEAPAGTFPKDAELSVTTVNEDTVDENIENVEETIEDAVEAARKKDKDLKNAKVLSSLKFDIKIVLPDGTELQPEGNKVKVKFTLAEKIGDCVDVNVYHLKEVESDAAAADTAEPNVDLKAEKIEGTVKTVPVEETTEAAEGTKAVKTTPEEVDEDGVLADGPVTNDVNEVTEFEGDTDGFSYYTVEFTYDELQYVLEGDSSIPLSDILAQLKIEGTVADVAVSNSELFSADKDADGNWTVTAHQAFSSEESMEVRMDDGNEYEITVTDSMGIPVSSSIELQNAIDDALDNELTTITLTGDSDIDCFSPITIGDGNDRKRIIIDLNGKTLKELNFKSEYNVIVVKKGSTLTITDNSYEKTGKITGGKASEGGGVYVSSGATFVMKGGSITGNTAEKGGGVYVSSGATFIMEGGDITDNIPSGNSYGGGVYNAGKFTMTGGCIEDNSAFNGGGVYNAGEFTITGGSIEKNNGSNDGGVYHGSNEASMSVGGNAKIAGNTRGMGNSTSNVFLKEEKTITIETGTNAPKAEMCIGVKTSGDEERVITSNAAGQYADCFSADENGYIIIVTSESKLKIIKDGAGGYHTVTFNTTGGTPETIQQNVENGTVPAKPLDPVKSGYEFSCWCTDEAATIPYNFDTPVETDFTLYAKWTKKEDPTPTPRRSSGGSTYTLFTGTTGNPVTNGTWRYDPQTDTWSYTTTRKFTETWGYIANPYANNEPAWFYFDRNGNMLTGWHWLYWNGTKRCYYFNPSKDTKRGKCQLGGVTPDGYTVDKTGAWTVNGVVQTR